MLTIKDSEELRSCTIAQDDDNDYSESGWIAIYKDGIAALSRYSHCSCFGTWESLSGGEGYNADPLDKFDWTGTIQQLIDMAAMKSDPHLKGRIADPADYDYDHLMNVYDQILAWAKTDSTLYLSKFSTQKSEDDALDDLRGLK